MAKLYLKAETDNRKTPLTATANQTMSIDIFYGSKDNSIKLATLSVYNPKFADRPNINLVVNQIDEEE